MANPTVGNLEFEPLAPGWGTNSDLYKEEWEEYLARHQQLVEQIRARLGAGQAMRGQFPQLSTPEAQALGDALINRTEAEKLDNRTYRRRELWDVQGRAEFYGINTEGKTPEEIWTEIEARRTMMRQDFIESDESPWAGYPAEVTNALFVGSLKGLVRLVDNLPFIGDAAAKRQEFQRFDSWLSMVDEAFTSHLSDSERTGQEVAQGFAATLPYLMPVGVVNNYMRAAVGSRNAALLAGRLGPLGKVALGGRAVGGGALSARQAFTAGAATAAVFETGGDAPWQERALMVALGGGLEGGGQFIYNRYGEALKAMFNRLQDSFPHRGIDVDFDPLEPRVVDAEWGFVEDLPGTRQNLPPFVEPEVIPPSRRLGPGPRPIGPGSRAIDEGTAGARSPFTANVLPEGSPSAVPGRPIFDDWTPSQTDVDAYLRDQQPWNPETDPIREAAVMYRGQIFTGVTHGEAAEAGARAGVIPPDAPFNTDVDAPDAGTIFGDLFVTESGRFVTRSQVIEQTGRTYAEEFIPSSRVPFVARATDMMTYRTVSPVTNAPSPRPIQEPAAFGTQNEPGTVGAARDDAILDRLFGEPGPSAARVEIPAEQEITGDFSEFVVDHAAMSTARGQIATEAGMVEISGSMQPNGDFHVTWIGHPDRGANVVDLGPRQIREIGRKFVQRLNQEGVFPENIVGERISGARGELAGSLGSNWEGNEAILGRVSARRLLNTPQQQAGISGSQITKQATIAESPIVAEMSVKADFDDMDVIRAAIATNPGEVSIVRNVGQERSQLWQNVRGELEEVPEFLVNKVQAGQYESSWGHTIQREGRQWRLTDPDGGEATFRTLRDARERLNQLAEQRLARTGQKLMPHTYRFVEHNGRTDLLISTGKPISNKMVKQYQQYGFFEGQRAHTFDGSEVIVREPGPMTRIYSPYSDQEYLIYPEELTPGRATVSGIDAPTPDAPMLYEQFRERVLSYMNREAQAAGLNRRFGWTDKETSTQLPRLLDEFFTDTGIEDPLVQETYKQYFNIRRVDDYRNTAPPADVIARETQLQRAAEAVQVAREQGLLYATVDELAEAKGFSIRISESGRGIELVDNFGDLQQAVPDEATAANFLRNVDRAQPDVLEPGDVPEELIDNVPGTSHPGSTVEPWVTGDMEIQTAEDMLLDDLLEVTDDFVDSPPFLGAGGGGRGSEPPPPPPAGGADEPDFLPQRRPTADLEAERRRELVAEVREILGSIDPAGPGTNWERFRDLLRSKGPMAYGALDQIADSRWVRWSPTRNAMAHLDENLQDMLGSPNVGLYEQYNAVSTGVINMNNESRQWLHEADDIVSKFRRQYLRDGTVVRIQEMGDPNQRIAAMMEAGYTDQERAAQNQLADYLDRFFRYMVGDEAFNINDSRYVVGYMSKIRNRQLAGEMDAFSDIDTLPRHLRFFAEEFRRGEMDFREMNVARILPRLIRAAMFHKHVAPSWTAMTQQWDQPWVPPSIRGYITGWLKVVRAGRDPREDGAIVGLRHFLNSVGVPVTNRDLQGFFGGLVGNIYRSYLGFRVDALAREAMQPWMAGVKIGHNYVNRAYGRYMLGTEDEVKQMIERALDNGWYEPGRPRLAMADVFETQMTPIEIIDNPAGAEPIPGLSGLAGRGGERYRQLVERREQWMQRFDAVWDAMPVQFRRGAQDTWADPLLAYTKVTSMGKIVAGNAAYDAATDALVQFKLGKLTLNGVADRIGLGYYPLPFRQAFQKMVEAGDLDGAAKRYASEVVADAMMRVGSIEQPEVLRNAGLRGRLGMMFGNFSMGFVHYTRSILKSGAKLGSRALTRYGAVVGALATAEAATGMKFSKWLWHQALWYSGGPAVETAAQAVLAGQGVAAEMQGYNPSYQQTAARSAFDVNRMLEGATEAFNPYQGIIRTAEGIQAGAMTPNPFYNSARFLITGERGDRPERERLMDWSPGVGTGGFPTGGSLAPNQGSGGLTPEGEGGSMIPPFIQEGGGGFMQ